MQHFSNHVATFIPSDYDSTVRVWYSRTKYGTLNTASKVMRSGDFFGTPTLETNNGISGKYYDPISKALLPIYYDGNSVTYPVFKGTQTQGCRFPTDIYSNDATYTFVHVARYTSSSVRKRIFDGNDVNWLSGYWNGRVGVAYHEDWVQIDDQDDEGNASNNNAGWNIIIDRHNSLRYQGKLITSTGNASGNGPTRITINYGRYGNGQNTYNPETSPFEVAEVLFFNEELPDVVCEKIEQYLSYKYQISLNPDSETSPYNSVPTIMGTVTGIESVTSGGGGWPYNQNGGSNVSTRNRSDSDFNTYIESGKRWQTGTGTGLTVNYSTGAFTITSHTHADDGGCTFGSNACTVNQTETKYYISTVSINNGGSGYKVGDIVSVDGLLDNSASICNNCDNGFSCDTNYNCPGGGSLPFENNATYGILIHKL